MIKNILFFLVVFTCLLADTHAQLPRIAFRADVAAVQTSPSSPLHFDAIKYNEGSSYSTSGNAFVAPTNGLYFFSLSLLWNGYGCGAVGGSIKVAAVRNSGDTLQYLGKLSPYRDRGNFSTAFSFSTKLSAGDRVRIGVVNTLCDLHSGGSLPVLYSGSFSGYRVYADQ